MATSASSAALSTSLNAASTSLSMSSTAMSYSGCLGEGVSINLCVELAATQQHKQSHLARRARGGRHICLVVVVVAKHGDHDL